MLPRLFACILAFSGRIREAARLNCCPVSHGVDHYMSATCGFYEQLQSPPVWGDCYIIVYDISIVLVWFFINYWLLFVLSIIIEYCGNRYKKITIFKFNVCYLLAIIIIQNQLLHRYSIFFVSAISGRQNKVNPRATCYLFISSLKMKKTNT
jgi:hypothetical protein